MASVEKGMAVIHSGTESETWGIVKNLTVTVNGELKKLTDKNGDVIARLITGVYKSVSGSFSPIVDQLDNSPASEAKLGEKMTIKLQGTDVIDVYINPGASIAYTNGEYSECSFEGETAPALVEA